MSYPNKTRFHDVARVAGVSLATVYRVMNGRGPASARTEAKVREAAKSLGLSALRAPRTKLLAFLLGNRALLHRFHSRVLAGAEACCVQHGYNVLIVSVRYPHDVGWKQLHLPRVIMRITQRHNRSEEHTSELQSLAYLVCRLLLEK